MGKINPKRLESQMKGKDIIIFTLSKSDYSDKIISIVKSIAQKGTGFCYVSVNKPAKALMSIFEAEHIDVNNFWFIDCISSSSSGENYGKSRKDSRILFVSSPKNLTEISIDVSGATSKAINNVFVDALSTFLIYNEGAVVTRFAHTLITKIREREGKGFFVVLKNDISGALLDDLSMFVDGVIEV